MHTLSAAFVLGFHGCDQEVAEKLLAGHEFDPSNNAYDWLGPGIYFWEANPRRGLEDAKELKRLRRGPRIDIPAVIGAVVDLRLCLDLTTATGIEQVRSAYKQLVAMTEGAGVKRPINSDDLLRRNLDCAVIKSVHQIRTQKDLPAIDTIKSVFIEGGRAYPESGFYEKTHVQICVCNPDCIKGVFRVRSKQLD